MSIKTIYNLNMMINDQLIDIFKVLQDPIRLRIIEILRFEQERREYLPDTLNAKDGFCPMDILALLHAENHGISNTKLSYHLKELKGNQIIYLVKEGKRHFYLLNKNSLETIHSWILSIIKE